MYEACTRTLDIASILEEAVPQAEVLTNGLVRWLDLKAIQPDVETLVGSISKEDITQAARASGWTLCFINMDYENMLEYARKWGFNNQITFSTYDYMNDEIGQKRDIITAIIAFFGPRFRPPYIGGFSTYNSLRLELCTMVVSGGTKMIGILKNKNYLKTKVALQRAR